MVKRTAYGALAILAILTLFSLDAAIARWALGAEDALAEPRFQLPPALANLFRHGSVVPVVFCIVALYGSAEFMRLAQAKGCRPRRLFTQIMVAAVFLSPWLSAGGWLGEDVAAIEGLYWPLVLLALGILGAGILHLAQGQTEGSICDMGATTLTLLYVGFLCSFAIQLRADPDNPGEQGAWLLLITLLVTKASDIGAYFTGSLFGRRKLAPRISPGKTVEGAVGGLAASMLVAVGVAIAAPVAVRLHLNDPAVSVIQEITGVFRGGPGIFQSVVRPLLFGLLVSAAAQCGDLFESCFKRDAEAKDSGNVLPQFGGILDLIDSPIFSVPVAWFLLTRTWHLI